MYYIKCNATVTTDTLPLTSLHSTTSSIHTIKFGDVDYDMAITVVDASMIEHHLLGERTLSVEQLYAADVDGDGQVTSSDAICIRQYNAGLIPNLPIENIE